jgi:glutathione S-transferase
VLKEDGGLTLAQSHAILRYVSKTRFDCKMFEPENEATINECLDWQLLRLRPTIATVLRFDRIRGSSLVDAPSVSVQSLVGKADGTDPRDVVRTTFDIVEDMLERRGGFLTGSEPSIADISASCEVEQFALEHESLVNEYSGMKKWLKYFRSIEAYNEAHHGLRRQHDKIVDKSAKGSFVKALRGGAIDT